MKLIFVDIFDCTKIRIKANYERITKISEIRL